MKLIAITILGVLLLASVGAAAGGAAAGAATQAGQSSVYLFDVPATASHGGGTLMINLAEHKFVFDGKAEPGMTYYLQYTLAGMQGVHQFASAAATPSGILHMEGMWTKKFGTWATKLASIQRTHTLGFAAATPSGNESETLTAAPTFVLSAATSTLTLDGKMCASFSLKTEVFGTLVQPTYENGVWVNEPLSGQPINIYSTELVYGQKTLWGTATTDSQGKFCKMFGGGASSGSLSVEYNGQYGQASDLNVEKVTKCAIC